MGYKYLAKLFSGLLLLSASFMVFAGIDVSPIIFDIQGNNSLKEDIRVYNDDTADAYVKVTPHLLINLGTPEQKSILVDDPEKLGLLVSPRVMVIPAHQTRSIRLVFLGNLPKADRLYQVDVEPTVGNFLMPKTGTDAGIKVLIGYGVIVVQRPSKITVKSSIKRVQNQLTISNLGNTNFVLGNGQQCDAAGKNCKELPAKRLYAGKTWQLTLPYATPATYLLSYLDTSRSIKSN